MALAFIAASRKEDHMLMDDLIAAHGEDAFAESLLRARGLEWAADLAARNLSKPDSKGEFDEA